MGFAVICDGSFGKNVVLSWTSPTTRKEALRHAKIRILYTEPHRVAGSYMQLMLV
jgi:hypothetical protein